jgi:hypothetical protein
LPGYLEGNIPLVPACYGRGKEFRMAPVIIVVALACAVGVAAFWRPYRVFRRAVIAAVCAIALPYVIAFAAGSFLGEGAGMGVAFILYAGAAAVLLAALAAVIGAAARHAWTALRVDRA